jgi:multidrug resistance efflux pump
MLQAEISLENAREAEAFAAEAWKQSMDRPWEPQGVRDAALAAYNKQSRALELAELQYQRAQVELDVYATQLRVRQKAVVRAEARLAAVEKETCEACERAVEDAERALAGARERLGHPELRAPQDGLVTAIDAYAGSVVSGETAIVTLLGVDDLYFTTLNLDERHAAFVRPGQQAAIVLRFYPEATVVGEVHALFPRLGGAEGARFVAHIRLVDTGGLTLLPGMTGRAEIALE